MVTAWRGSSRDTSWTTSRAIARWQVRANFRNSRIIRTSRTCRRTLTSLQTGLFTHGRKQSASWPMAGIDWVRDVSASRLNGQHVNNKLRQVRRVNHGQRERLVAGRVRHASFTSFLKIAALFAAGRPVDLSAVVTKLTRLGARPAGRRGGHDD